MNILSGASDSDNILNDHSVPLDEISLSLRDPLLPSHLSLQGLPSYPFLSFCSLIPLLYLPTSGFSAQTFTVLDLSCLFSFPTGQPSNAAMKIINITGNYIHTQNYFCEKTCQNFIR